MAMSIMANAGVPMLLWQLPGMVLALVPVVLLETLIAGRHLELGFRERLTGIAVANVWSTFVGVPVAWGVMTMIPSMTGGVVTTDTSAPLLALQVVAMEAAWPDAYEGQLSWLIAAAGIALLIPYYFASVVVERWVLRHRWSSQQRKPIHAAVWRMNAASYLCLALLLIALLWRDLP